jgi:hypothetical protein
MGEWDRRIPWRQGHILTADAVTSLGLVPDADATSRVVIVVTHNCDLAQSPNVEPMVEVMVGRRIGGPNGNFTHGKNPRRLHISATEAGSSVWIELTATARQSVPKPELCRHVPSATIKIDFTDLDTLQYWLAARYRRSAFPDEFDRRLDETRIAARLKKILEPVGNHILAVFFDVDEGTEREHKGEHDPFTLSIELLYSTAVDSTIAEAAARRASEGITVAFRECCFDKQTNKWRNIELLDCTPISDEALTYAMSLKLKRWNADYISFRADPAQPMVKE